MTQDRILRQIADIQADSLDGLRDRWRDLFQTEPPRYSRAALVRRLAYRVQELAYGGVTEATRAGLEAHLDRVDGPASQAGRARMTRRKTDDSPVIGTRFVRTWRGERYEATVVAGGVEFEGRTYRSLSAVARAITGTRWNGRLFFGLRKRGVQG